MTHCLYERAAKVLARLRGCAGSPEPSLLAKAISTKFAWRGPFDIVRSFTVHGISVFFFFFSIMLLSSLPLVLIPEQHFEIKKIIWDADKVTEFRDVLNTNLDALETCINNTVCQNPNIDDGGNKFEHTIYNSAFQVFG